MTGTRKLVRRKDFRRLVAPVLGRLAVVGSRLAALLSRLPALRWVTGTGWVVLAVGALGLPLGGLLGWSEFTLVALTALVAFALACLFTLGRAALGVVIEPSRPRLTVGKGGESVVRVAVTNSARSRLWPLELEVPVGSEVERFAVPGLAAGATFGVDRIRITPDRRGVVRIGPPTSVRSDPIGLLRRAVRWPAVREVFIHPETVPVGPLGSGLLRDLEGYTTADLSMSDLAFHTLREYVPGDDRRHIHWRSSAKLAEDGKFLVRQYLDTRKAHFVVLVDGDSASYPDPADFESALSAGASICLRAIADEVDTTALAAGHACHDKVPAPMLDTFARAALGEVADLTTQAAKAAALVPDATIVTLITGSVPEFAALRRALAQFPPEARTVVLRVDPTTPTGLTGAASLTVLTIRTLSDLPTVLQAWTPA